MLCAESNRNLVMESIYSHYIQTQTTSQSDQARGVLISPVLKKSMNFPLSAHDGQCGSALQVQ